MIVNKTACCIIIVRVVIMKGEIVIVNMTACCIIIVRVGNHERLSRQFRAICWDGRNRHCSVFIIS